MSQFNVGDVVQLNSGGPKMTISDLYNENGVDCASCCWFDMNNKNYSAFPLATLTKI